VTLLPHLSLSCTYLSPSSLIWKKKNPHIFALHSANQTTTIILFATKHPTPPPPKKKKKNRSKGSSLLSPLSSPSWSASQCPWSTGPTSLHWHRTMPYHLHEVSITIIKIDNTPGHMRVIQISVLRLVRGDLYLICFIFAGFCQHMQGRNKKMVDVRNKSNMASCWSVKK
jgi:hypothetical protein